jgi:hypothetical protein
MTDDKLVKNSSQKNYSPTLIPKVTVMKISFTIKSHADENIFTHKVKLAHWVYTYTETMTMTSPLNPS